jgi:MFS family permease
MLSAVGVCLPAIGREYAATAVALSLVESVFLGVNAMFLLPLGRAGDILGREAVFFFGLALFSLTSFALTLAPSMEVLLTIRAVQAVGGAMTLATGLALVYDAFPVEERGKALGMSSAGIFFGISAGPVLGGLIASQLGWRWVFNLGMAPCALALLVCFRNLNWRPSFASGERFDWPGAVTSALSVALLVFGSAHTDSAWGWRSLAAGALALVAFLVVEAKVKTPLLHLSLFSSNRPFSLGLASICIVSSAAFGVSFLLSLYLQYGRDMTPAQAGVLLAIQPIMQCIVSPLSGRLSGKRPTHVLAGIGALLSALGVCLAATLDAGSGQGMVIAILAVVGIGIGVFATPSMLVVMSSVDQTRYGVASAMSGQSRTLGMTACMAAVTIVIAHYVGARPLSADVFPQYLAAMRVVFIGAGIVGVLGAGLSFLAGQRPANAGEITTPRR